MLSQLAWSAQLGTLRINYAEELYSFVHPLDIPSRLSVYSLIGGSPSHGADIKFLETSGIRLLLIRLATSLRSWICHLPHFDTGSGTMPGTGHLEYTPIHVFLFFFFSLFFFELRNLYSMGRVLHFYETTRQFSQFPPCFRHSFALSLLSS